MGAGLRLLTIVSEPFAENTYVAWLPGRTEAVVVDPGLDPEAIFDALDSEELTVAAILNTHGHSDHIAGNAAMKDRFPTAPLLIGVDDAPLLADPRLNLSAAFGFHIVSPPADRLLREGDRLEFAGLAFDVLDVPGHSPGHVVFVFRDGEQTGVFGGDVLFRGSIGRTDFPGGSFETLAAGIRGKMYRLPEATTIYPGHGPVTTVGHEKRTNPFVPGE